MFGLVVALVVLGTTIWVGFDSATNQVSTSSKNPYTPNTGAVAWVLGCILLWIVVFPFYLYRRSQTLRQNVAGGMSSMPGVPRTAIGPFCRSCGQHVLPEATLCPSCGAATGPPSIQPSAVDGAPPAHALAPTPRPQPSATGAPPQTAQPQPLAPRPPASPLKRS